MSSSVKWTPATTVSWVTTRPSGKTAPSASRPEINPRCSSSARSSSSVRLDSGSKPEHVDGAGPRPDAGEAVAYRLGRDSRRAASRLLERLAASEERGQRRRVRATGAVRGFARVAVDGDRNVVAAVEEPVDSLGSMAAGHDDGG